LSGARKPNAAALVSREYRSSPESCARAVTLLFKAEKNAAGCDQHRDGDDAKKGSLKHEVRANPSLPR